MFFVSLRKRTQTGIFVCVQIQLETTADTSAPGRPSKRDGEVDINLVQFTEYSRINDAKFV